MNINSGTKIIILLVIIFIIWYISKDSSINHFTTFSNMEIPSSLVNQIYVSSESNYMQLDNILRQINTILTKSPITNDDINKLKLNITTYENLITPVINQAKSYINTFPDSKSFQSYIESIKNTTLNQFIDDTKSTSNITLNNINTIQQFINKMLNNLNNIQSIISTLQNTISKLPKNKFNSSIINNLQTKNTNSQTYLKLLIADIFIVINFLNYAQKQVQIKQNQQNQLNQPSQQNQLSQQNQSQQNQVNQPSQQTAMAQLNNYLLNILVENNLNDMQNKVTNTLPFLLNGLNSVQQSNINQDNISAVRQNLNDLIVLNNTINNINNLYNNNNIPSNANDRYLIDNKSLIKPYIDNIQNFISKSMPIIQQLVNNYQQN